MTFKHQCQSLYGMKVIQSPHVPKRKIPVRPSTGDMSAMVEHLIEIGEARPQFREVDQVLILNGNIIAPRQVAAIIGWAT